MKMIILDKFGRVPTDSSTQRIVASVSDATDNYGRYKTLAGKKYNDPELLLKAINSGTIVVSICDDQSFKCICGPQKIREFKKALHDATTNESSWDIVNSRI